MICQTRTSAPGSWHCNKRGVPGTIEPPLNGSIVNLGESRCSSTTSTRNCATSSVMIGEVK